MELLVVITIIVVLAALSFTGYGYTMKKVQMAKTMENMRQLATGTLLYSQDHNGNIPRGDEGADGAGVGGRGIIWINHIAPNIGYPELETQVLNKSVDGMDQWTYLLTKYKSAPFVCGASRMKSWKRRRRPPSMPSAASAITHTVGHIETRGWSEQCELGGSKRANSVLLDHLSDVPLHVCEQL